MIVYNSVNENLLNNFFLFFCLVLTSVRADNNEGTIPNFLQNDNKFTNGLEQRVA